MTEGGDDSTQRARASRVLAFTALGGTAVVLVVSFAQGPPRTLPGVALGWPVVLYLERAALLGAVIMGLGGVAYSMLRGDAVRSFSAPGGPAVEVAQQAAEQAADADEALRDALDGSFRELDERVSRLERERNEAEDREVE